MPTNSFLASVVLTWCWSQLLSSLHLIFWLSTIFLRSRYRKHQVWLHPMASMPNRLGKHVSCLIMTWWGGWEKRRHHGWRKLKRIQKLSIIQIVTSSNQSDSLAINTVTLHLSLTLCLRLTTFRKETLRQDLSGGGSPVGEEIAGRGMGEPDSKRQEAIHGELSSQFALWMTRVWSH